jgi:Protein of unknown function (DUF550)
MTSNERDEEYPFPWKPAPHAPWLLISANNRQVAHFQAWNDNSGSLIVSERHCAQAAYAMNEKYGKLGHAISYADPPEPHDVDLNWNDLRVMQHLVVQWADSAMPDRTPTHALLKMSEEIGELIRDPTDPEEYADLFIMLVDLAAMHGVTDLGAAVKAKMKINANRKWEQMPTGTMQHTNEQDI